MRAILDRDDARAGLLQHQRSRDHIITECQARSFMSIDQQQIRVL